MGARYGKLVVVAPAVPRLFPSQPHPHKVWKVRCDCGTEQNVLQSNLHSGRSRSCGCEVSPGCVRWHRKSGRDGFTMLHRAEWCIWYRMLERCYNEKHRGYKNYGARGISVCSKWRKSFRSFFEYIGARPSAAYSLDRINVNKSYEPGNVRWATRKQQARNTRTNRVLKFQGKSAPLVEWAEKTGLSPSVIWKRLALGWTVERALSQPVPS